MVSEALGHLMRVDTQSGLLVGQRHSGAGKGVVCSGLGEIVHCWRIWWCISRRRWWVRLWSMIPLTCLLIFPGHPFDLTKTRLQTAPPGAYKGAIDVVKQTVSRDGISGCVVTCLDDFISSEIDDLASTVVWFPRF
jgi:hypothetical protein